MTSDPLRETGWHFPRTPFHYQFMTTVFDLFISD